MPGVLAVGHIGQCGEMWAMLAMDSCVPMRDKTSRWLGVRLLWT